MWIFHIIWAASPGKNFWTLSYNINKLTLHYVLSIGKVSFFYLHSSSSVSSSGNSFSRFVYYMIFYSSLAKSASLILSLYDLRLYSSIASCNRSSAERSLIVLMKSRNWLTVYTCLFILDPPLSNWLLQI